MGLIILYNSRALSQPLHRATKPLKLFLAVKIMQRSSHYGIQPTRIHIQQRRFTSRHRNIDVLPAQREFYLRRVFILDSEGHDASLRDPAISYNNSRQWAQLRAQHVRSEER